MKMEAADTPEMFASIYELQSLISQETVPFMVIDVRSSNPTGPFFICVL
jgi:hypothetical protein